jgi:hypothetical protein
MRNWVIGGCVVAIVVVAAVVFTPSKAKPPAPPALKPPATAPAPVAMTPPPTEPAVLTEVVDVTDIDPLLDPPAIPLADPGPSVPMLTAVGYEVPAPRPAEPTVPVVPIPPAAEDEPEGRSIAPMPREAS